jgi:MerR family transcriptional regulator, thiopeptide resistance regulator
MLTVGAVAELTNVTIRALHHYDEIGLVQPSQRTAAGYRLYDTGDLERLQTVLFYRELGFSLDDIDTLLRDPGFDRGDALREQRKLLEAEAHRYRRMVEAIDAAIDAHERGIPMENEAMFEVFGEQQRAYRREAEQRWGDTDAWAQSRRRTADYTERDWLDLKAESEAITLRILEVYRSGADPDSAEAMDAVDAHRQQISRRFYACSHEMQVHLGDMYVADPRFTATYEGLAEGLTVWVRDAIHANAHRAGVDVHGP